MTVSAKANGGRRLGPMAALAVGFLLLGVVILLAGIAINLGRCPTFWRFGPCPASGSGPYPLERSLVAASVMATVIGLRMLSELTRGSPGLGPAKAGADLYMFGGVLVVGVELALADGQTLPGAEGLVVGYVVLAFLGQAAVGWGLTKGLEGLKVVGWVTIAFNLGTLAAVVIVSRNDMYFPIAHVFMPALIAAALLVRKWRSPNEKGTGATVVRNSA